MRLIKREPGVGYLDTWLWIPKSRVDITQIESTFLYQGRDGSAIEAWREEPYHFRVPRNFLRKETLKRLPYQIFDTRQAVFPRIDIRSRVVLDALDPTQTFQRRGSEALLSTTDGILCFRCGAGKTVVALHSAAQLNTPFLIMVTDDGLSEQWAEEIEDWLSCRDIGFIGGKRGKGGLDWEHEIVIAQVATLSRRAKDNALPEEMARHFGVVIADEVHTLGAPHFNAALPPFPGRRWGLSATPTREDGFDSLLQYTIGNVIYSFLTPDLIPDVLFSTLPTTLNFKDPVVRGYTHASGPKGDFHYGMTYGYLARTNQDRRNDRIAEKIRGALAQGREVLVLTHSKEMTEILGAMFPGSGVVNGGVKGKERRRRIRECNPVIAIMSLGKQALNKPRLDTLYVTEPFSKSGVLQQTMGRVLRTFSGKKRPVVIFFEDVSIDPLTFLCSKLRRKLMNWPAEKGGKIPFKIVKNI